MKWYISYHWRNPNFPTSVGNWADEVTELPPDKWSAKWRKANDGWPMLVVCAVPLPKEDTGA